MKYIALDVGSSFIKAALLDMTSCKVLEKGKISTPRKLVNEDKNIFEISANLLFEIFKGIIDDYAKKYKEIEGVVFSTQMHGFVYTNPNANKHMEDTYISWQDSRCLNLIEGEEISYIDKLKEIFPKSEMVNSGVNIKPSLGLCNLYTLLYGKNDESKSGNLYTLGSYFINRLTGNNICHITNAAPLGLVDIVNYTWDEKLIKKAGFTNISFPTIAQNDFQICGIYKSNGQSIKIYPDFGDHQVSILGSMAEKNDIVINIATASQVSNTLDTFIPGDYETRPFFEGRYMNTISNMPGGRNLDVLIDFIKDTVKQITGISIETDIIWNSILNNFTNDNQDIKVDTAFYPVPYNMNGGKIDGIKFNNFSLNNVISAAFNNMAEVYDEHIKILSRSSGVKINKIVCSGGVSWKIPQLLEIIGNKTKYSINLSPLPDEVFSGLFRIALVCSGINTCLDDNKELLLKY